MCIYCGTKNYRKIYKNHYGQIPKDEKGRSYEIHHIDANHSNNDPNNLKCVSLQEHYDIHKSNGQYNACFKMALRLKLSTDEISEIAKKMNEQKLSDGSHHFLDSNWQSWAANKRIDMGLCVFTDSKWQSKNQFKILEKGKHPSQIKWSCKHCGTSGKGKGNYTRLHGNNCPSFTKKTRKPSAIFLNNYKCEHCGTMSNAGNYKQHHGNNCKKRT